MTQGVKKKDRHEWLKGLTLEKFKEVWIEWYIPALENKFYLLEDRIKKLEKPGK